MIFHLVAIAMLATGCSVLHDSGQLLALESGVIDYANAQNITTTDANSTLSTGTVGPGLIRAVCSANAHWNHGANPTATTQHPLVGVQNPVYYYFSAAEKVAIIRVTTTNPTCSFVKMLEQ